MKTIHKTGCKLKTYTFNIKVMFLLVT